MVIKTYEEHDGTIIVTMENKEADKFVLKICQAPYQESDIHKKKAYEYAQTLADFMGCMYIRIPPGE